VRGRIIGSADINLYTEENRAHSIIDRYFDIRDRLLSEIYDEL
jgi:hypothetical protein